MTVSPSREDVARLAQGGVGVPVFRHLLGDLETPLTAYWKLAHDQPHSFLLESVTGGEQVGRYSVLGVPDSVHALSADDSGDPFRLLEVPPAVRIPGLPPFVGGLVGMLGYDLARHIEHLPKAPRDDLGTPLCAVMRTGPVVVFDHAKNQITVAALATDAETGYDAAVRSIHAVCDRLASPLPALPTSSGSGGEVRSSSSQTEFESAVRRIQEYIVAGDCIQAVPSVRFSTQFNAHPVSLYRALRSINPSPYMFLLRYGGFDLVGASPELLVSLHGYTARVRPIAGTRRRGNSEAEDARLAEELLADEKERAEHVMLVDLGRNDLGRVCEFGSVTVDALMRIDRYSHVMHIVSEVTGTLRRGLSGIDLLKACFPAGTVSGAPKVRAMQIIDELEPTRRGPYAGAVGYFSNSGDLDLCIAIRTILLKDGMAHVQAGAGIVHDSIPSSEWEECANKAKAGLAAIELAQRGF